MVTGIVLLLLSADPLSVSVGTQQVLRVPGLTKLAIGDPAIADVRVTGANEVLVMGKQLGKTSLMLWTSRGLQTRTVAVDDGHVGELSDRIHRLVSPSLRVETFGGLTVIDGVLDSVEEWSRLKALVGEDASVRILAHLNPRVMPVLAQRITEAFQKAGLRQARAECVGQTLFLEGSVADDAELHRALAIADAMSAQVSQGRLQVK